MQRTVILTALAAALAAAAPAAAQSTADVIRNTIRERVRDVRTVVRYQGRADSREQQTERFTRTVRIGENGEIDLSNIAGDIVITRGGGSEATIEVVKTARGRTVEDAREQLQLVTVDFQERGSRVEVRTRYPRTEEARRNNRRNINVSVAYNVTAPAGTRVTARSISGDISARDIRGELSLESVSGMIRVHNGGRVAAAKSISGNVEVVETEVDGVLEASSVSGTVLLRRVKAQRLDASVISGNVVIEDVDCGRIEGQSISGDVRFGGALVRNGRYELTSHSGEVRVAIAGGTGFELEAGSFSGSIRTEFPITAQGAGQSGRRQRTVRGVYGDGSAVLDLNTFSGTIVITKR
jgi:DUF4097 and DUF4098 domain-containing protein YvlB